MGDEEDDRDRQIEREIRRGRTFSIAEMIGREGGNYLKGASPVPPQMQAVTAINQFVRSHLSDSSGALWSTLAMKIKNREKAVARHHDDPLVALEEILESLLRDAPSLQEFVREVDSECGRLMAERPHFQKPGQPPHPDDDYTHESVREDLTRLLGAVREQNTAE